MGLFDRSSVRSGTRLGGLSSSMFFVRHSPHPQRVRHIAGLNGAMVCNVNDDLTRNRPKRTKSLKFNKNNLPTTERTRRTERLIPPTDFWHTHGVIHETDHWKQELAALATASGIGIEKDDQKHSNKSPTTVDQKNSSRSGAHYSNRTGRFNEGESKSRGRTNTKHGTAPSDTLFNVSENEREMWMLQVLCQLLDTSNLEDVQSWLVSASAAEKEHARSMINSALCGLKESERASHQTQESVDFDSLSNFVEKQKSEEKCASEKYVNDTLNRSAPVLPSVDEQQPQQQPDFGLNDTWDLSGVNSTYGFASNKKNNTYNENGQDGENEEQIDTIHLEDDRRRPQSTSPRDRPLASHRQNSNVESMQYPDETGSHTMNYMSEVQNNYGSDEVPGDSSKSRKIRELQNKLSRQEEESKKKFDELQTKQSRLENAIRLLAKQNSPRMKNGQGTSNQPEDAPIVNVIIQSPGEKERRGKTNKSRATPFIHADTKSKKSHDHPSRTKVGDYNVEDVKVQISLSRLDNHQPKVYGGVWKPDAQTLQRLQGY